MAEALSTGVDHGPSRGLPGGELFALIATADDTGAAAWLAQEIAPDAFTRAARTLAAHAVRGGAEFAWVESVVRASEQPWPLIAAVDDALTLEDHATERRAWLQTAAGLLDERPQRPAARAGVWRRLALVCLAQRDREGATLALLRHREVADAWHRDSPSDPAAVSEIAWVQVLAGDAAWRLGRAAAGAAGAYQRALTLLEPRYGALAMDGEPARLLGRSVARLGDMHRAQGDLGGALAAYRRSLGICQHGAVAHPSSAEWLRELARCHARLGDVMSEQQDAGGALLAYRQSLQLFERLQQHDPAQVLAERDLAGAHLKVGDALLAQGNVAGALVAYRHGTAIRSRLAAARAGAVNAELRHDLWMAFGKLADVHERMGSPEAAHWWRQAHDLLAELKAAGQFSADADEQFLAWLRQKAFPGGRPAGPG